MTTKHALARVCERVGIRDEESAASFVESAAALGLEPKAFRNAELRNYLDGKARTANRVVVHMGIVVVLGLDGSCITAYPLPSPLLDAYQKETKKHD